MKGNHIVRLKLSDQQPYFYSASVRAYRHWSFDLRLWSKGLVEARIGWRQCLSGLGKGALASEDRIVALEKLKVLQPVGRMASF